MAESIISEGLIFAFLGGFLPALFWLWFWLHEDQKNPEPRGLIFLTFLSGMLAVPIVLFFEALTQSFFFPTGEFSISKIIAWAAIEEVIKYALVFFGVFRAKAFDEPIDAVMYMITAALGFAALENTLFLATSFGDGSVFQWLMTGNARFLGAMVLHTVSSGLVGAGVGFAFYAKKRRYKLLGLVGGLLAGIALHASFNFFIIEGEGQNTMGVFFGLWLVALLAIGIFEKVRTTKPTHTNK